MRLTLNVPSIEFVDWPPIVAALKDQGAVRIVITTADPKPGVEQMTANPGELR